MTALRLTTIARTENEKEAKSSFRTLVRHLGHLPLDVLDEALRIYTIEPGRRFYPRSAGEVLAFANPILRQRQHRAYRFDQMADAAADQERERRHLAEPYAYTDEDIRLFSPSSRRALIQRGWLTQEAVDRAISTIGDD